MQFKKKFTTNYSSILSKPSQILQSEKKRTDLIIDDQRRSNHLVSYETLNSINGIVIFETEPIVVLVVLLSFFE